jgi:hypothetical protein
MDALTWMTDPNLCGTTFGGPTFLAGRTAIAAAFGLEMTPEMFQIYTECTGRTTAPTTPFSRVVWIWGRGGGKTLHAAFVCVYQAASRDWHAVLGPGEIAVVALITPDRAQSRQAFNFIRGLFRGSAMLERLIVSQTRHSLTLSTGVRIEIHTASFKSTRGYGFAAVVLDEAAFLPVLEQSANPDVELVRAVTPGLARVPGSLLLVVSTPYARRGVVFSEFQKWHAVDGAPVLTFVAPTRRMNPMIAQETVDLALLEDATANRAEYLSEFRGDLESYANREVIDAAIVPGRHELPPSPWQEHVAFVDPSGGSKDSMALAIAHGDDAGRAVLDCLREVRPPPAFSPEKVVGEFAAVLHAYRVREVTGDHYGGVFVREPFARHGLVYRLSERAKSDIYASFLPLLNSGRVELLDDRRLVSQLVALERRTARGGRDSIDHRSGAHDDVCNAACGALCLAVEPQQRWLTQRPALGV